MNIAVLRHRYKCLYVSCAEDDVQFACNLAGNGLYKNIVSGNIITLCVL